MKGYNVNEGGRKHVMKKKISILLAVVLVGIVVVSVFAMEQLGYTPMYEVDIDTVAEPLEDYVYDYYYYCDAFVTEDEVQYAVSLSKEELSEIFDRFAFDFETRPVDDVHELFMTFTESLRCPFTDAPVTVMTVTPEECEYIEWIPEDEIEYLALEDISWFDVAMDQFWYEQRQIDSLIRSEAMVAYLTTLGVVALAHEVDIDVLSYYNCEQCGFHAFAQEVSVNMRECEESAFGFFIPTDLYCQRRRHGINYDAMHCQYLRRYRQLFCRPCQWSSLIVVGEVDYIQPACRRQCPH